VCSSDLGTKVNVKIGDIMKGGESIVAIK